MPSKSIVNNNTKKTIDLKYPTKGDGSKDNRFSTPQFVKNDGTRDLRTKLTNNRK